MLVISLMNIRNLSWNRIQSIPNLFSPIALLLVFAASGSGALASENKVNQDQLETGRKIYMEGLLPSGQPVKAFVQNDIALSEEQASCGSCHRKSGMGSSEGQQVVPAIAGRILFNPLQIPTSKPPEAPILRPAYTDQSLRRAITSGLGADGYPLDPNMPRYNLSEQDLDAVVAYLKSLSSEYSPGVDEGVIHFATIVAGDASESAQDAHMAVMNKFLKQKNTETRHEGKRAENAPWHKKWIMGNYRKWKLHTWKLTGPADSWAEQLASYYRTAPVFAVIGGVAGGSWQPVHDFCQSNRLPCIFPTTNLPVISDSDFYPLYLSKGMFLEGEAVADQIALAGLGDKTAVQVYTKGDQKAATAAEGLRKTLGENGGDVQDVVLTSDHDMSADTLSELSSAEVLVLWLKWQDIEKIWSQITAKGIPGNLYLSSSLAGKPSADVGTSLRDKALFVHTQGLPGQLHRLLARSTGWLRANRIYKPEHKHVQGNAFFALKAAGDAVTNIRGFFLRDYFIERIEHMVDNAPYTSVYPRITLAPNQRFVSKGYIISRLGKSGRHMAVTDWVAPR